jgi:hypothetical protein
MKLTRLRRMTVGEMAGRGRQHAQKWIDRVAPALRFGRTRPTWTGAAGDTAAEAARHRFLTTAPCRFFPGGSEGVIPTLMVERFPDARRAVLASADAVLEGRFDLLGYTGLEFGTPIDWHLDPVAHTRAPLVHWTRIDPLDPTVVGDSKVVWELNRHQWMVTLAQAYVLTGHVPYAERVFELLDEWSQANPYGIGINWTSSLEGSIRLMAWTWTLVLLRGAPVLTGERFARLSAAIGTHARHIERYLSYYFSPNTHLTGEALGLVYAGVVFADSPDAARWRDLGRRILTSEAHRQVSEDGVYVEQASCYHRYTAEIYLHLLLLAEQNRMPLDPAVPTVVMKLLDWLLGVMQPDRTMPAIGDADGGWLLPFTRRQPNDCRGLFAVAAAVFEQPEYAWAAGGPAPELVWLLGRDGLRRFGRLGFRAPGATARAFGTGGYAVMRSSWQPDAHQIIVDAGPLGCEVSGAHGHADLLSIQCAVFGEPFLIDPGTYCYTPEPAWRNYFRGTAAHNTIRIDGQNQAEPAGPFAWHSRPAARITAWDTRESHDFLDAEHDSYLRLPKPVKHRRRVLFVKPRGWVVVDDLTGEGVHDIELRFHFSPRPVTIGPGLWARAQGQRGAGLWLVPLSAMPLAPLLREGHEAPIDGWMSPGYGVRRPTPVVIYEGTLAVPLRITTLVVPADPLGAAPPVLDLLRDEQGEIVSFRFPGDDRVIHVATDSLTIEDGTECLRIA